LSNIVNLVKLEGFKNMDLQFPELQIISPETFLSEVQLWAR